MTPKAPHPDWLSTKESGYITAITAPDGRCIKYAEPPDIQYKSAAFRQDTPMTMASIRAARAERAPIAIPDRSIGDHFISSKKYRQELNQGGHAAGYKYEVELDAAFKSPLDMFGGGLTTAPGGVFVRAVPVTVIDFIPETPTQAASVNYIVELVLGSETAPVADATLKPAVTLAYANRTAPVETIADWIKVSLAVMDDSAAVGYAIDTRLTAAVRLAEQNQVLNGDGAAPNLTGILTWPGIGAPATIPAAIASLQGVGYSPSAILLNPANWETARASAATAGAYVYDFIAGVHRFYGVPAISTPSVPAGMGLIGDFAAGSHIWRRQNARVLVGNVNDDIVKNLMTLVGESRIAFAVTQPQAFSKLIAT